MLVDEFKKLSRCKEDLTPAIWKGVNDLYMSEGKWHKANGGVDESKRDFIARVFGNKKRHTKKSIAACIADEECKENRYALIGNAWATEERLTVMDRLIRRDWNTILKYGL